MEEISGISPQNQRYWIKTYDNMKAQFKQNKINCKGQGAKSAFFKYENEIINFIDENRKYNIAVTTFMVISKIISLYKDFNLKSKHAQLLSVYKFLKRHNLSIRKSSHLGQPLWDDAKNQYYSFLYETVQKRKLYHILDNFNQ